MSQSESNEGVHREGRRSFLKKVGVGAAVAWTAPTIASSPAWAQTTCGIASPLDIPPPLGSSLVGWWDGADPTTINPIPGPPPLADVALVDWADKSGNGYTLSQPTVANQPLWLFNTGINGLGSVSFDGVDDFLTTIIATFGTMAASTVFVVAQEAAAWPAPAGSGGTLLTAWDGTNVAGPSWDVGGTATANPAETFGVGATDGVTPVTAGTSSGLTNPELITLRQTPTQSQLYLGNPPLVDYFNLGTPLADLTPAYAGGTVQTLQVGTRPTGLTGTFTGLIGEIIIFDWALTDLEVEQMQCLLNLKWFV